MKKRSLGMLTGLFLTLLFAHAQVTRQDHRTDKEEEHLLVSSIEYIEQEEDLFDLGYDHYQYLPEDFDPFIGMIYALDSIQYIEEEQEEIVIGDEPIWFLYY
ncbi:MAG: hypothetical protein AAF634_05325 [Bacteroidota bacterium]